MTDDLYGDTVSRSFRIFEKWDKILKIDAFKKGMSVSGLLNQIIRDYFQFDRFIEKYSPLLFSQQTCTDIFDSLNDDEIIKLGRKAGRNRSKDLMLMMGRKVDLDSVDYFVNVILDRHFNWFNCFRNETGREITYFFNHTLRDGWGLFIKSYMQGLFESLMDIPIHTEIRDGSVTIILKDNK
jgi:hypothetical protein